ncbi:Zn-dependent hydrolase/oxidoreductase [Hortaea werneckii]|nr:Zn-dependent hydrolase/oxidoreductase [Hortaea werneckii]KAI7565769.1 Zn-dependent hydrolase/oxidoreductase [Hortaea werneckii]KAI7616749.1 Zn-dependent hydrolase/oxidoreductase [Hortaea werneckii]KAI7627586.1 Zn-dependent hydrolase/oxidoreductase [Hortaea werneckii]KAI7706549.1 Zn-dependent hydrolase/oxidoreductase [Hortaea werneckii]
MGISDKKVTELDWWDERTITLSAPPSEIGSVASSNGSEGPDKPQNITATIGCLPCQHTSARTPFDKGHTLWASWSVTSGGKKVWFGGDTGYRKVPELPKDEFDYSEKYSHLPHCPAFKQIGELRGPFDLGLIPIGAYDPRFIMSPMHANPYDSVNIFADTKCERALGIHWGTWVLTTEEVLEPPKKLKEALKWKGMPEEADPASMAPTKEGSKANRKKPGQDAAVLKKTGATKKVTKRLSKNVRPVGRDLFTTLPAELRNEIYELTLIEEKIFVVGSVKSQRPPQNPDHYSDLTEVASVRLAKIRKSGTSHEKGSLALRLAPWKEPGILQVCHSVREEASQMYYGSNKFVARAGLIDFGKLGAWLKTLRRRCGPQPLFGLRISVTNASWLGLHNAIDLARAIHSSGMTLQPLAESLLWANHWGPELSNNVIQLYKSTQYRMEEPLNEALDLSHLANIQSRSKSWLTRRLNMWLQRHLKPYRVRKALHGADVHRLEENASADVKGKRPDQGGRGQ